MESFFEERLEWYAGRSLAGKFPRGEIAASTTYAREILRLRALAVVSKGATVAHMTEPTTNKPSILQWVDDIPAARMPQRPDKSAYESLFAELRDHPNEWALIGDGTNGVLAGSAGFLRTKGFRVRTRTVDGDERDAKGRKLIAVYAQYPLT